MQVAAARQSAVESAAAEVAAAKREAAEASEAAARVVGVVGEAQRGQAGSQAELEVARELAEAAASAAASTAAESRAELQRLNGELAVAQEAAAAAEAQRASASAVATAAKDEASRLRQELLVAKQAGAAAEMAASRRVEEAREMAREARDMAAAAVAQLADEKTLRVAAEAALSAQAALSARRRPRRVGWRLGGLMMFVLCLLMGAMTSQGYSPTAFAATHWAGITRPRPIAVEKAAPQSRGIRLRRVMSRLMQWRKLQGLREWRHRRQMEFKVEKTKAEVQELRSLWWLRA